MVPSVFPFIVFQMLIIIILIVIQAMREIINDKRYNALKTLGERKQAFNEVRVRPHMGPCILDLTSYPSLCIK
jgi:Tfp pilus assembly protein PilX